MFHTVFSQIGAIPECGKLTNISCYLRSLGGSTPPLRAAVDIGFIVCNQLNYPGLTTPFADLGVESEEGLRTLRGASAATSEYRTCECLRYQLGDRRTQ